jgi:predicted Zn-dependent protease
MLAGMSLKHALLACGVALLLTACAAPARSCYFPSSFNGLCAEAMRAGRLDEAERHCDDGLALFPESADLWLTRGLIAFEQGDLLGAKTHFLQSLSLDPSQTLAHVGLSVIHLREGTPLAAQADLNECVRVSPDDETCWEQLRALQHELASGALRH